MTIREGREDDIDGIFDLEVNTFSVPWSREAIQKEFQNDVATYLVAVHEEKVIGYVGVWCVLDEGQITNVAVHKDYRQQGIGKKLIDHLVDFAKTKKLTQLVLEVRVSNINAQKLYSKCGFQELGKRKNYYTKPTEDAIFMALNIE